MQLVFIVQLRNMVNFTLSNIYVKMVPMSKQKLRRDGHLFILVTFGHSSSFNLAFTLSYLYSNKIRKANYHSVKYN